MLKMLKGGSTFIFSNKISHPKSFYYMRFIEWISEYLQWLCEGLNSFFSDRSRPSEHHLWDWNQKGGMQYSAWKPYNTEGWQRNWTHGVDHEELRCYFKKITLTTGLLAVAKLAASLSCLWCLLLESFNFFHKNLLWYTDLWATAEARPAWTTNRNRETEQ